VSSQALLKPVSQVRILPGAQAKQQFRACFWGLKIVSCPSRALSFFGCWRASCRVPVSFRFATRVTRWHPLACPYRALSGCQVSRPSTQGEQGMPDREFKVDFVQRVRAGLVDDWRWNNSSQRGSIVDLKGNQAWILHPEEPSSEPGLIVARSAGPRSV